MHVCARTALAVPVVGELPAALGTPTARFVLLVSPGGAWTMVKLAMMNTLRVKDVMTEAILLLRAEMPVDDAWALLHDGGVNGAPVLDRRGRLVGVLSNADLADPRRRQPGASVCVGDVMTRVVYAVRADDAVLTAVRLMADENIHRAVVVNEDGTLAGVVVPMDILRVLGREADARIEYVDLKALQSAQSA